MEKIFVTGTDTGIGKTWVSLLLLDALRAAGRETAGFKPLSCGAERDAGGRLLHEDASALQAGSSLALPYGLVNPICLPEPTAPHIAADRAQRQLELAEMLEHSAAIERHVRASCGDAKSALVCEGVGGWDVPLNPQESMADFACGLEARIVLVIGLRLGCLNHARLSHRAICRDLLEYGGEEARSRLAGMVINCIEPGYPFAEAYIEALRDSLGLDLLAIVSHGGKEAIGLPWL